MSSNVKLSITGSSSEIETIFNIGTIIGIVIGIICGIAMIISVIISIYCCCKAQKSTRVWNQSTNQYSNSNQKQIMENV